MPSITRGFSFPGFASAQRDRVPPSVSTLRYDPTSNAPARIRLPRWDRNGASVAVDRNRIAHMLLCYTLTRLFVHD